MEVLYEDNHIIVVEKPRNMPVAPDASGDPSLLEEVKQYIKVKYEKPGEAYIGLVHRLDRPAGGVVVFARTSKAAARLSEQVRTHEAGRTYFAVVRGTPPKQADRLEHTLLKDTAENMVNIVPPSTEGGKNAILNYRIVQTITTKEYGVLTLVQVQLETGRSHQIRAQMAHIGCPLFGDQRYGFSVNKKGQQLALYAVKLSLNHPTLKQRMSFICYPPEILPWTLFTLRIE